MINDLSLNKEIEAVLQECEHVSDKSGKTMANCNLSAKTKKTDKDRKQKKASNGQKKSFNKIKVKVITVNSDKRWGPSLNKNLISL